VEPLQALLQRASITDWDILLVGDGSGSKWDHPCGWATTLIDRATEGRKLVFGANNLGSVNMAEMLPYLMALSWFHQQFGKERLRQRAPIHVHIITDSQVTAQHGTRVANHALPNVGHRPFWAGIQELGRMGYRLTYHWAVRSDSTLNWMADLIAGLARREIKLLGTDVLFDGNGSQALAEKALGVIGQLRFCDPGSGEVISPYHLNPTASQT
jgi:hypothetical protein